MTQIDPKLKQWATSTQAAYIDAVNHYGSGGKAAKALGVAKNAVNQAIVMVRRKAVRSGYAPEFDLTHPIAPGQMLRGTSTLYKDGKPLVQWVKTQADADGMEMVLREFVTGLVEEARGISPTIAAPLHNDEDLLVVIPMGDPHYGLHAWSQETGEDFDLKIAETLMHGAIDRLVEQAPPAEFALLLNLGDFFHIDNQTNQTSSGNQLDADSRWAKVMQVGLRAMIHAVKRMLMKFKHVTVRNVRGNHDMHGSYALSLAMDAYFSNSNRVTVDLSPAAFWYFRFGKVLIGASHGNNCKMDMLPGIMACDRATDWGEAKYRYWYTGHIHHDELREFPGCTVESFRTLAAKDAWHTAQGYRAGRDMRCIVIHRDYGEIGRIRCDIAMLQAVKSEE